MPDNAPEKLFDNLPNKVPFPLNKKDRLPHGLCYFAGEDESLPDAETIWQGSFEATEKEVAFANNKAKVEKALSAYMLFGRPYIGPRPTEEDEDFFLQIGLGKQPECESILYVIIPEEDNLLFIGRTEEANLTYFIEDITLFSRAMPEFPVHPSRIASGKDGFCMEDYKPSEAQSQLGPWNFAALRSNSLKNLRSKAMATLTRISTPDRLWAVYIRTNGADMDAAVFSLVEAGGNIREKPLMLFDMPADIEFDTGERGSLLRLMFFWQ